MKLRFKIASGSLEDGKDFLRYYFSAARYIMFKIVYNKYTIAIFCKYGR